MRSGAMVVVGLVLVACGGPEEATPVDAGTVVRGCGNGLVEAGEACDDGNLSDTDACTRFCVSASCGDGKLRTDLAPGADGHEECDDGNRLAGDGCDRSCRVEVCGNGKVDAREGCDDGNASDTDACTGRCEPARCGDGFVRTDVAEGEAEFEQCDDGNDASGDGCGATCRREECGNGVQEAGEACDDGNAEETDACRNDCSENLCGDGAVHTGVEACDDGNGVEGDGCDSLCRVESCGNGRVDAGEACDDGNADATDACLVGCIAARCGDGFVRAGVEVCDDGNAFDTDTCSSTCQPARCGDGVVQTGVEACDDGNAVDDDLCANDCAVCASGQLDAQGRCLVPDTTPPTVQLSSPAAGATGIALDLPALVVAFSEAIAPSSWSAELVTLREVGSGRLLVPAAASFDASGLLLTLMLPATTLPGCATLCPSESYELVVGGAITDVAGNALAPVGAGERFFSAGCTDAAAPRIASTAAVSLVGDQSATVSWTTDERATASVAFVSCGGGSCPADVAAVDAAACDSVDICALPADEAGFACGHTARLTGLTPSTTYQVEVRATDSGGRAAVPVALTFTTLAAQPRLAITELFAAPKTASTGPLTDADQAKFVEIQNIGLIPVDLTPTGSGATRKAWKLARCPDSACSGTLTNVWSMKPTSGSAVLAPGEVAVAAGNSFDPVLMGLPSGVTELRNDGTSTTVLSNGLTASTAYAYALLNPDGVIVSTYGNHLGKPNLAATSGRSFERRDPAGADDAANWSVSNATVAGAAGNYATPGARNSVTP